MLRGVPDTHARASEITRWLLAWSEGQRDAFDHLVLHVYNLAAHRAANLRVAVRPLSSVASSAGRLAFLVDENAQGGTDLNDDGRINGAVAFLFLDRSLLNLGLASGDHAVGLADGIAALTVDEALQLDGDLNHDGDSADDVAHVVRFPPRGP